MKLNVLFTCITVIYFLFGCSEREKVIEYYNNGSIKCIYEVIDSVTPNKDTIKLIDGLGKYFYISGNKMAEAYYNRSLGLPNPINEEPFDILAMDNIDGSYKLYFDSTDLLVRVEGEYNKGIAEYLKKFNEHGELKWKKTFYDNGKIYKIETFYDNVSDNLSTPLTPATLYPADASIPGEREIQEYRKQDDIIEELREYNDDRELVQHQKYYFEGSASFIYKKNSDGSSIEENFNKDGSLESKKIIANNNGEFSGRIEIYFNDKLKELRYLHAPEFDMYFDSVLVFESGRIKKRKLYERCYEEETSLYQIHIYEDGTLKNIEHYTTRPGNCNNVYVFKTESLNSEVLPNLTYKDAVNVEDGSAKKAKKILGQPDITGCMKVGSKYVYVYFNKISHNGKKKHLVLFIRDGYPKIVEDVQAVSDGERAYFGFHYIELNDYEVTGHIKKY